MVFDTIVTALFPDDCLSYLREIKMLLILCNFMDLGQRQEYVSCLLGGLTHSTHSQLEVKMPAIAFDSNISFVSYYLLYVFSYYRKDG